MYNFFYVFLIFFIYSILGYFCECLYCTIRTKKIVSNRGFLVGPYLPIYGTGLLLIIILLSKYYKDPLVLFIMSSLLATVIEYFTSYIMEIVFKARWWDYSDRKYNVNGRICLLNTFLFGIGGLLIMYIINPIITGLLSKLSIKLLIVIGIISFVIFMSDVFISIITIYKIRVNSKVVNKDLTKEISIQVKEILKKNTYFMKRMLSAFPKIKNVQRYNKLKELLEKNK